MPEVGHLVRTTARFAHILFSGSDDPDAGGRKETATAYSQEQQQFARKLFAPDDPEAGVLAGLIGGKNAGKWQHAKPEVVDNGPWFDRRPAIDD